MGIAPAFRDNHLFYGLMLLGGAMAGVVDHMLNAPSVGPALLVVVAVCIIGAIRDTPSLIPGMS